MPQIRHFFKEHPHWKPTAIHPTHHPTLQDLTTWIKEEQEGGHSCSVPNSKNLIYKMIMSGNFDTHEIQCGDPKQGSVISKTLRHRNTERKIEHTVILNLRSTENFEEIVKRIDGVDYKETYPFKDANGASQKKHLHRSPLVEILHSLENNRIQIKFEPNPGRSDSSRIWKTLDPTLRDRVIPFTCGPGNRSHRDGDILRKTHGVNEGFQKASARETLPQFIKLLRHFSA